MGQASQATRLWSSPQGVRTPSSTLVIFGIALHNCSFSDPPVSLREGFSFPDRAIMTVAYDPDNIFAKILRGEIPAHKVYEDEHVLAFMDIMPRADGHVLVIPRHPARNILDITPDALSNLAIGVQKVAKAVKAAMKAAGVTIQQFNESAGGQVVFHIHFHVIPRFEGVPMKPHTGQMADPDVLKVNAERIRSYFA
jgi:histidine triad (HIT) family protein